MFSSSYKKIVSKIASLTRKRGLTRLDPMLRFLHNPDKQTPASSIKAIIHNHQGYLFNIDTSSYLEWSIFFYGGYEPYIHYLLSILTPHNGVCIDIGANIGIHTLAMARAVGNQGTVLSFEPHPIIFDKLIKNISLNHLTHVRLIQAALSSEEGFAQLESYQENQSNQGTSFISTHTSPNARYYSVKKFTLDDYLKRHALEHVDLIKIDVEGHESEVLSGAQQIITTSKPVIIFEDSTLTCINDQSPIKKMLSDLGYSFYEIGSHFCREISNKKISVRNFLALPQHQNIAKF